MRRIEKKVASGIRLTATTRDGLHSVSIGDGLDIVHLRSAAHGASELISR